MPRRIAFSQIANHQDSADIDVPTFVFEGRTYFYHTGDVLSAKHLVETYHYSHRISANIQYVATLHEPGGILGFKGDAVAAMVFSLPPTRWAEPVLELTRLVRADYVHIPLTSMVSWAMRRIRASKLFDLVVSFADSTQGHHGGIYQAGSWNFHEFRPPRRTGLMIGDRYVPCRTANSIYGSNSPRRLRERFPVGTRIEEVMDDGKYLYWRSLSKTGSSKADRLELRVNPYPKPRGMQLTIDPDAEVSDATEERLSSDIPVFTD